MSRDLNRDDIIVKSLYSDAISGYFTNILKSNYENNCRKTPSS